MENKFTILIVDDDAGLTSNLQDIMEAKGYRIAVANDGQTALTLHEKSIFDLALVDIRLPDMSGVNLIKKLAEPSPRVEYIIITGYASLDGAIDAVNQRNIVGYLTKPLNIEYLTFLIRQVSERKKAEEALENREEKYRSLVNNVSLGVFRSSPEDNGSFLEVNPAMEEITGYSREELLTMKVSELYLHPEERERILSQAASGRTTEELLLRKKDGTIITVSDVKTTIKDKGGKIQYFDGILSDITERKQMEHALSERYKEIQCLHSIDMIGSRAGLNEQEICQAMVNILPQAWQYPEVTGARLTLHGKKFETKNYRDAKWKQSSDIKLYGVKAGEVEIVYREEKPKLDEGPFMKEERQLINSVAEQLARIIEGKQAKKSLQESEERFRTIFDTVNDGIILTDLGNQKFYIGNTVMYQMLGYSAKEVRNLGVMDIHPKEDWPYVMEQFEKQSKGDITLATDIPVKRKDGSVFYTDVNSAPITLAGKTYLLGTFRDVTERKQAEDAMKRAAEEWRTTFDSIVDLVSIHDKDFKLVRVNKAFVDTFNMKPEELVGKTCYQVVHGTNECMPHCPHIKTLETGEPATGNFFEPHLGIHLEVTASPIFDDKGEVVASVHVTRDITERKKAEEQLILTDRLASIGELAAGIAHELNNPLTSVIGFAQLLLDKDVSDDVKEDIKVIYSEAQRTAEVVKHLLTFARKHAPVKQLVNINSIIEKVLELRAYEQRVSNIQVNTKLAPDLPEITADYFQLQQVFLNIIINAEHFMIEAHNRGTLTIITERTGDIIRASFTDDGPGISKENLGHLFDPFFTTKEVGKGTGLGLSICHGIITEHHGQIYAESELGKGAIFVVGLPLNKIDKEGAVE